MQWNWATSLDQLWRSPGFGSWVAVGIAGCFVLILLITLLRADKSVANVTWAIVALAAIAVAAGSQMQGVAVPAVTQPVTQPGNVMPRGAVSAAATCLDGLAGETVEAACERAVFASAESTASAVSHAAAQLSTLAAFGGSTSGQATSSERRALMRGLEQDRYGIVAQVLIVRDGCSPNNCSILGLLSDPARIRANMAERLYDGMVARYSPGWANVSSQASAGAWLPSQPTGRSTTADFPSSASIPPVSIMTPEPATRTALPPASATPSPAPRPAGAAANAQAPPRAPKKQSATPAARPRDSAPASLVPAEPADN